MRERRQERSEQPQEALRLFLSRVAEDRALDAAIVSDGDGLLIGGTARKKGVDLEALAALRQGPGVLATTLRYAEATLYLVTQGPAKVPLDLARAAVGRILSLRTA